MRTRREIIYLNIDNLTPEEKEKLSDMGLNACDKCGDVYPAKELLLLEGENFIDDPIAIKLLNDNYPIAIKLLNDNYVVVCESCYIIFQQIEI